MTTHADPSTLSIHHWQAYAVVARIADRIIGGPGGVPPYEYSLMVNEVVGDIWTILAIAAAAEICALNVFLRRAREAGAFHADAETVEVASETRPGVTYTVALDGSRCTCPGFRFHGHCKHTTPAQRRAA